MAKGFSFDRKLGMLLLAIWLVLAGLSSLGFAFHGMHIVSGVLALAAGVLLLLDR